MGRPKNTAERLVNQGLSWQKNDYRTRKLGGGGMRKGVAPWEGRGGGGGGERDWWSPRWHGGARSLGSHRDN